MKKEYQKNEPKIEERFQEIEKKLLEPIDTSNLQPITPEELIGMLGLTIKRDEINKLTTFLCQLSAYTENSQFNISFNAPSSTGKSYIPTEIAKLFPEKDVLEIGYCSPTAFFHDLGKYDKKKNKYFVDLSRKILIFLDQPHTHLLERLRPLLSHDKKEIALKITDKSQKYGLKTKNVFLRGYPSVIFCTAGLRINEQEATRFLLLSPEINQEKIREAIYERLKKESDRASYNEWLESDPERASLKQRILAIKQEGVEEVKIPDPEKIAKEFLKRNKMLKPRHSRDVGRLISLIKSFALLNLWHRERDESSIIANQEDINNAFDVWEQISESQELNLPPYIFNLYKDVIIPLWNEENELKKAIQSLKERGLSRQDILKKHYQVYGRHLSENQLRREIIPMLDTAGLITQDQDPSDKRRILIYPTAPLNTNENNSSEGGGVNNHDYFGKTKDS